MHHSDVAYWRYLQSLPRGHEDLPSPRACKLLLRMFERWKGRPGWLVEEQVGHLFRGRDDLSETDRDALAAQPVVVRKALAVQRMLEIILDPKIAASSGSSEILADELIIGTLPPFAVGQGKEFVRYLTEEEELSGALTFLNELSPMGHIVPNHELVLHHGLDALAADARSRAANNGASARQRAFHKAVAISLESVAVYAARHAEMARDAATKLASGDPRQDSLERVAACLDVAPRGPAQSFHQALQAIYIVHCALHWTVEIVPIGRLDQLLDSYLKRDLDAGTLTLEDAQELIDCFWIKLDERVILDNRHAENRFTASDGVLTGYLGSSNYDQGALLNQWMQQVTVGGLLPQDGLPVDACNAVTRLCLEASRRLPLNSPTLDLRVHSGTPRDVLHLAARALMSGGAHPVLLNDDIIVPALAENSAAPIPLAAARNYACDGCYETMVAGESEFSFGFVSALDLIEKALNRGAGLAGAGPVNLRGTKDSWRSKPAALIADMDEFRAIMREHLVLGCHRYFTSLTSLYGNKADFAPSPLLSALISGCVEKGRDLTEGGSNYHIFSPLLVGVSNAADSMFAIERLVFDEKAFTLEELTTCLATDWGHSIRVRSVERGYARPDSREPSGFEDGITNPRDGAGPPSMNDFVYVRAEDGEPNWCAGGTYLAYRKIRRRLKGFFDLTPTAQEAVLGVEKNSGSRLEPHDAHSHAAKINPRRKNHLDLFDMDDLERRFLRRPYFFDDGLDAAGEEVRGLHHLSFVRNLGAQYEWPVLMWQTNPDFPTPGAGIDAIYGPGGAANIGGGYYFMPAAPDDDDHLGSRLGL